MIQLHIDVDNLWMYEQEFGIKLHKDPEYIYTQALPLFLKLLRKSKSKATFMIIGKDLKLPACKEFCQKAIREGYEIANHTWSHPISFGTLFFEQKKQEIVKAHKKITEVCGKAPIGFRGAGYYQDTEIISILKGLNYQYDASVLPGFAQILMNAYANVRGKENRHKTFGRADYILSSQHPHKVHGLIENQTLQELPISVLPFVRLPIHTTFAYFFGPWYRELILRYIRSKPKYLLYLFHAIDFVDLPKQNSNHPVITLRYSFEERMNFAECIVNTLVNSNGVPLETSQESTKSTHH